MKRSGFTLIELMIAMGLMVLLMLGVGYIFKSVGNASSVTLVMSRLNRDAQAAQAVMSQDFAGIVTKDAPFLIIKSARMGAFRNKLDQLGAPNIASPMTDTDETGSPITLKDTIYNQRNHRVDQLKFFSRGSFKRQTGNDGTFIEDMGSTEAQISYGHLSLYDGTSPDRNASPSFPTVGTATLVSNPNNFYSTQWIVGHNTLVLIKADSANEIKNNGVIQNRYENTTVSSMLNSSIKSSDPVNYTIQSSRYDVVKTYIDQERDRVRNLIRTPSAGWYQQFTYRFWSNPIFLKPLDSYKVSQTVPLFLQSCTQFMVEYAGDWLNQNPTTGAITSVQCYLDAGGTAHAGTTDGQTDFIVGPDGSHRIRWYGFPRDVASLTTVAPFVIAGPDAKILLDTNPNKIVDVVPLRDVIRAFTGASDIGAPMEHFTASLNPAPPSNDWAQANLLPTQNYTCAWGPAYIDGAGNSISPPNPPSMIRITYTLDDPNGRLADGQTFEYVFKTQ